eukprot:CAMPEP_0168754564 /NCGR_PEP_ID=MMETSP0724-20121128/19572_1 /TAXON_ID=265536 /ORGANISM="Amphiprora sp., Strain CCMP467" /LENGTH=43 /DNA_ID= /DNA_START= /DNA_END= /DNA_ORIENTATION=
MTQIEFSENTGKYGNGKPETAGERGKMKVRMHHPQMRMHHVKV